MIGLEKRPIKFGQECLNTLLVRNVVGFEEANLNKLNNSWTLFWRCLWDLEAQRHCCSIPSVARVLQVPEGFKIPWTPTKQRLTNLDTRARAQTHFNSCKMCRDTKVVKL